ncbi:RidA family protein [Microbacterium sp.]|uniref:RidA family protein n=1 Tax=Microbacterium sp. TaxID=51671 RepID=UPI002811FD5C|nr:RidA family protein [Microbacterium sp.]
MTSIRFISPAGLVQSPAFNHVAVVPPGFATVFVGGQNAVDGSGELVGAGDAAAQVGRVMENLREALRAADADMQDLVSMTIIIVDGVDLVAAYPVAAAALGGAAPVVSVVTVTGLAVPGALVEVSAIAAVPAADRAG